MAILHMLFSSCSNVYVFFFLLVELTASFFIFFFCSSSGLDNSIHLSIWRILLYNSRSFSIFLNVYLMVKTTLTLVVWGRRVKISVSYKFKCNITQILFKLNTTSVLYDYMPRTTCLPMHCKCHQI